MYGNAGSIFTDARTNTIIQNNITINMNAAGTQSSSALYASNTPQPNASPFVQIAEEAIDNLALNQPRF